MNDRPAASGLCVWASTKYSASCRNVMRIGRPISRRLLQAQDVLHVIEAGFLADDPSGGAECTLGEGFAAGSFVGQFQPLAGVGEDYRVVAYDISTADG